MSEEKQCINCSRKLPTGVGPFLCADCQWKSPEIIRKLKDQIEVLKK